ncbi:Glycoside hydrolase subgroup catalytic core [Macrophomina phaseolina MS6]|uniref:Glycoside hydrolase subgroup catalytic core n=1 Tax=Macrophomina phaseolina (strain MS6) TaxID=1126212 RepID=K2T0T1_MACPH|nr:Glycoside hydrolase subgroup catalytic core [Macrophomina phaseolina MS6]
MPAWQCTMAQAIKDNLGSGKSDILVATGGGGWVDVSVLDGYMSCAAIDVIGIHAYGNGDLTAAKLQPKVARAQQAGKKLVMQEWGVCYYSTQKNQECNGGTAAGDAARGQNIQTWAAQINQAGIPAWYWMVIPNNDPHGSEDFEVGVTESIWGTLRRTMQSAKTYEGAFDFSRWLL